MKTRILVFSALLCAAVSGMAREWSLEECVNYAIENNLTVKSQELQVKRGELEIVQAKDRFLPTLDASASQSFNFGRGLTAENTYADRNTSNFQWGVNFNLPPVSGAERIPQAQLCQVVASADAV